MPLSIVGGDMSLLFSLKWYYALVYRGRGYVFIVLFEVVLCPCLSWEVICLYCSL